MKILILGAPAASAAGATAAQTLSLSGPGGQSASLTAADVAALPHVQVSAKAHGQTHVYSGVMLPDILVRVGAPRGEAIKGPDWPRWSASRRRTATGAGPGADRSDREDRGPQALDDEQGRQGPLRHFGPSAAPRRSVVANS